MPEPKAWIFVLAAVSAFRPADLPIAGGSALVVLTVMLVVLPTAAAWMSVGAVIGRLLSSDRSHRAVNGGVALLLAGSVVYLWI